MMKRDILSTSMKQKQATSSNYDFFVRTDTSQFKGEWIAIAGDRVVAHGNDAQKVYAAAQKKTRSQPISLAKAPDEQMLVLSFHV